MVKFIVLVLAIAAAAALRMQCGRFEKRRKLYIDGMDRFIEKCRRYNAVVLDVSDVPIDKDGTTVRSVILQFRDTEKNATVVHRYTGSSGIKYVRGSKVDLYYCEETDSACIINDNPFYHKARFCSFLKFLCNLGAVVLVAAGIVFMVL
jgi:hypothetical protein